jgi:hypothetical protein
VGVPLVTDPIREDRGWAFTGGEYADEVSGFRFLSRSAVTVRGVIAASAGLENVWRAFRP